MERTHIVDGIQTVVGGILERDIPSLPEDTRLFDDLGLDSGSILELLIGLEDTLGVDIDTAQLDIGGVRTVGTLADYLAARMP